ncbi:hypothetical protein PIB30_067356 [Stylosanthes scabra]|nr:hypothetical protein [Stylosanthes scabra]
MECDSPPNLQSSQSLRAFSFLSSVLRCFCQSPTFSLLPTKVIFFLFLWFKSLLPMIFGSKRTRRGSDDDAFTKPQGESDNGLTLGLHFARRILGGIILRRFHLNW